MMEIIIFKNKYKQKIKTSNKIFSESLKLKSHLVDFNMKLCMRGTRCDVN